MAFPTRENRLSEDVPFCVTQETRFCAMLYHHLPKTCVQISVSHTDNVCTTLRLTSHLVIRCLESKLYSFPCVSSNDKWNARALITRTHALDWDYYILMQSNRTAHFRERTCVLHWLTIRRQYFLGSDSDEIETS